jgi:hypothetical protein
VSEADEATEGKLGWRQKLTAELIEYWVLVAYLGCFFGAFTWYRRIVLAEYQIGYAHWGVAIIEALVLAKVTLIGDVLRLGRRLAHRPLIVVSVYKAVVFSLWVGAFTVVEELVDGWLRGVGWAGAVADLLGSGRYELSAKCLVTLVAFIPFFAFGELEGVLGKGRIRTLLFGRGAASAARG